MTAYLTLEEANTYFNSSRLIKDAWDKSDDAKRTRALNQASNIIDNINYEGEKLDVNQEHQFPRTPSTSTSIPVDILNACAEIAYVLLEGKDPEKEFENLQITQEEFANQLRVNYNRATVPEHIIAGVPSIIAWRYLKPYVSDIRVIAVSRVS